MAHVHRIEGIVLNGLRNTVHVVGGRKKVRGWKEQVITDHQCFAEDLGLYPVSNTEP